MTLTNEPEKGMEQRADEDWMEMEAAMSRCARCGTARPETPPEDAIEDHGWYIVATGELVCLRCLTPTEVDKEANESASANQLVEVWKQKREGGS